MLFGLQGTPATFQRLMDRIVKGCENFAAAYLDDLIIFSTSWSDHVSHVCTILQKLLGARITANPNKCQFEMAKYTYLGHIVGSSCETPTV